MVHRQKAWVRIHRGLTVLPWFSVPDAAGASVGPERRGRALQGSECSEDFTRAIRLPRDLRVLASGALAQTAPPEGVRVRQLGPMQPHWVFLISPAGLDSEEAAKVEVVDGDALQILGMLTGGLLSTAALSPDHKSIFMADTFYSRGSARRSTDLVTIYDAKSLAPAHEVVIPPQTPAPYSTR